MVGVRTCSARMQSRFDGSGSSSISDGLHVCRLNVSDMNAARACSSNDIVRVTHVVPSGSRSRHTVRSSVRTRAHRPYHALARGRSGEPSLRAAMRLIASPASHGPRSNHFGHFELRNFNNYEGTSSKC